MLCDGCGKCCLHKLIDDDTGDYLFTNVACRLLDTETRRCRNYAERRRFVPDCVLLTPDNLEHLDWMPKTCAYRLRHEGKPLPDWHPLICGDPEGPFKAGESVTGRCVTEHLAGPLEHHIVEDID